MSAAAISETSLQRRLLTQETVLPSTAPSLKMVAKRCLGVTTGKDFDAAAMAALKELEV